MNNNDIILENINKILLEIQDLKSSLQISAPSNISKIDETQKKITKLLNLLPSFELEKILPILEGYTIGLILGIDLKYSDDVSSILSEK